MKRNRKAKILATLGPATSNLNIIESLFNAGADVFRLWVANCDYQGDLKFSDEIMHLGRILEIINGLRHS